MLFDVQAALAEILSEPPPATVATPATNRANVAKVASVAGATAPKQTPADVLAFIAQPSAPKPSRHDAENLPNGRCRHTGRPRTWTGKVVALEDWRGLSIWDRNGPAGRLFCGVCRDWVSRGGGCPLPGCWKGGRA